MKTLVGILAVIVALLSWKVFFHDNASAPTAAQHSTVFERVMKTNTLRCGYAVATPWFMVDPNTKALSGVDYDVTMAVADKMGVKVDWVEETGWGVAEQGLISGRYDALCGNVCIDPHRARAVWYSTPFLHLPLNPVVRADDHRFDGNLDSINNKDVRIGVKANHVFEFTAKERFPEATRVYMNDISDDTEFFLDLTSNKIDIAFSAPETVDIYSKTNPGKIRMLDEPAHMCNGGFLLPQGDTSLKHIVDLAITEINTSGLLETIIRKYTKFDPHYVRQPAMPYREQLK